MRAEHDIAAEIEAVLRVERRMILGEIQRVEVVALRLGFRAGDARETELAEDVADLVDDLGDEMQSAPPLPAAGHRVIHIGERRGAALELDHTRLTRMLELYVACNHLS